MTPAGDAIGVRGKKFKSYTVKDRKKDLEEYQKTGVHPGIEAERRRAEADALLALPDSDASRPRTYIEFAIDRTVIGGLDYSECLILHDGRPHARDANFSSYVVPMCQFAEPA